MKKAVYAVKAIKLREQNINERLTYPAYTAFAAVFVLTAFSAFTAFPLFAANPGESGGQALKLGADSRPVAFGEAFCALADDASAVYWNPAGLTQLENRQISLTHMNRLIDIRSFNVAYAQPLDNQGAIGLGLYGLYSQDTRREETTGNELGKFMDYNTYFSLVWARQWAPKFSLGFGAKLIYNQLDAYQSSNIALEASGLYSLSDNLRLGLNLQNVPLGTRFSGELETIPVNIKTGAAYDPLGRNFALAADINVPWDAKPSVHLGGEYWVARRFAARAGYQHDFQKTNPGGFNGLSVGWGLKVGKYGLDYAFTPYGEFGNDSHRVTVVVRI